MKKLFLILTASLLLNWTNEYVWLSTDKGVAHDISSFIKNDIVEGEYILNPLQGNCKDDEGVNGHGWKFNVADYYGCDRLQRLLNGNFKAAKLNSPKY